MAYRFHTHSFNQPISKGEHIQPKMLRSNRADRMIFRSYHFYTKLQLLHISKTNPEVRFILTM